MPAEWAPHEAVWIGFPSHVNAWEAEPLAPAQMQMAAIANAVHDAGRGELVRLIAGMPEAAAGARDLVDSGVVVETHGDAGEHVGSRCDGGDGREGLGRVRLVRAA